MNRVFHKRSNVQVRFSILHHVWRNKKSNKSGLDSELVGREVCAQAENSLTENACAQADSPGHRSRHTIHELKRTAELKRIAEMKRTAELKQTAELSITSKELEYDIENEYF